MQKKKFVILFLFSILIVFVKQREGFFALNNSTVKTNTHLEVSKFNACTIIVHFDDGSEAYKNIVNNGTDVITVVVKNASLAVVSTKNFIYAEGKPACDIYDGSKNLIGHIEINITLTLCGRIDRKDALEDFQNIITQQITKQISI